MRIVMRDGVPVSSVNFGGGAKICEKKTDYQ